MQASIPVLIWAPSGPGTQVRKYGNKIQEVAVGKSNIKHRSQSIRLFLRKTNT